MAAKKKEPVTEEKPVDCYVMDDLWREYMGRKVMVEDQKWQYIGVVAALSPMHVKLDSAWRVLRTYDSQGRVTLGDFLAGKRDTLNREPWPGVIDRNGAAITLFHGSLAPPAVR